MGDGRTRGSTVSLSLFSGFLRNFRFLKLAQSRSVV